MAIKNKGQLPLGKAAYPAVRKQQNQIYETKFSELLVTSSALIVAHHLILKFRI